MKKTLVQMIVLLSTVSAFAGGSGLDMANADKFLAITCLGGDYSEKSIVEYDKRIVVAFYRQANNRYTTAANIGGGLSVPYDFKGEGSMDEFTYANLRKSKGTVITKARFSDDTIEVDFKNETVKLNSRGQEYVFIGLACKQR